MILTPVRMEVGLLTTLISAGSARFAAPRATAKRLFKNQKVSVFSVYVHTFGGPIFNKMSTRACKAAKVRLMRQSAPKGRQWEPKAIKGTWVTSGDSLRASQREPVGT